MILEKYFKKALCKPKLQRREKLKGILCYPKWPVALQNQIYVLI